MEAGFQNQELVMVVVVLPVVVLPVVVLPVVVLPVVVFQDRVLTVVEKL